METQNFDFFLKKVRNSNFDEELNHLSFVNISPTLVIDMSTEMFSRVLQHGNQKFDFFFKKV